jgi:hypothetical protein
MNVKKPVPTYVEMSTFLFPNKQSLQQEVLLKFLNKLLVVNRKNPISCIENFYIDRNKLNYNETINLFLNNVNKLSQYFNLVSDSGSKLTVEMVIEKMVNTCGYTVFYMMKRKRVHRSRYITVSILCIK